MAVDCPHCGWKTKLAAPEAPPAVEPVQEQRSAAGRVALALAIFVLVGAGAFFYLRWERGHTPAGPQASPISGTNSAAAPKPHASEQTTFTTNDLAVGSIRLERTTNSTVIYAVGKVKNESDRQRFGVKVELDLFDGAGEKIGSASDYLSILEPKKEWRFKALVLERKAVTARFAAIKEDQ